MVEAEVRSQRANNSYLAGMNREPLLDSLSWQNSQLGFCKLLFKLEKSWQKLMIIN
jgi:hypothetical protein